MRKWPRLHLRVQLFAIRNIIYYQNARGMGIQASRIMLVIITRTSYERDLSSAQELDAAVQSDEEASPSSTQ